MCASCITDQEIDSEAEDSEHGEKLRQVKVVLEEVALKYQNRFRVEMTFSQGADLSPLEANDRDASSWHQEHTLAINGPERLQEVGSYLTFKRMEKMIRLFAMPAEDFPKPTIPQGFSGYFSKSAALLECLVNICPFNRNSSHTNEK